MSQMESLPITLGISFAINTRLAAIFVITTIRAGNESTAYCNNICENG